jgi:N-ethylmaleimide reductase
VTAACSTCEGFAVWRHAARELGERGLAYLHLVEPRTDQNSDINF